MGQRVSIPLDVLNKVLTKLGSEPYTEVFELIQLLTSSVVMLPEENDEKKQDNS